MLGRTVLGLDIGSYAVKVALLRAGLRGVEFLRLERLVLPPSASPEEREATLELFLQQRGLAAELTVTALSASKQTQRHVRLPFTGAKRVNQAIAFEIQDAVPLPLDSVILAHEQVPASPEQTDVLAVLAHRTQIEEHLASLRRMGLEPRVIEAEGASLANLSGYLELAEIGRLILDVGHRSTNACLLVDGKPALLRSIPVGGHHLTEAIAADQRLSYDAAEELKHESGVFERLSTKPRTPGLAAALDQLARETSRSVQAVVGDPLDPIAPTELLLAGGSAAIEGLPEYLAERTGLPCSRLAVPEGTPGAEALAEAGAPVFAQAAALALRGSTTERVTSMDFRQGPFAYVPDLSGLRVQLLLTLGLFALVLVLWIAGTYAELTSARGRVNALRAQVSDLYAQTFEGEPVPEDPVAELETRLRDERELANHLGVTGSGLSVLEVLRHLSDRIPESLDVSFSELRLEQHNLSARGYAPDYASADRMREQLLGVDSFEEVVISNVVNVPRRGGKSFSLTIKFGEGAP